MLEDLKEWTMWMLRYAVIVVVLGFAVSVSPFGRDNSDPGQWGARSQLAPRTDALTGCQYLETRGGGLAPRVDSEGRHVGCKRGG